jgi:hypothetical protein
MQKLLALNLSKNGDFQAEYHLINICHIGYIVEKGTPRRLYDYQSIAWPLVKIGFSFFHYKSKKVV